MEVVDQAKVHLRSTQSVSKTCSSTTIHLQINHRCRRSTATDLSLRIVRVQGQVQDKMHLLHPNPMLTKQLDKMLIEDRIRTLAKKHLINQPQQFQEKQLSTTPVANQDWKPSTRIWLAQVSKMFKTPVSLCCQKL